MHENLEGGNNPWEAFTFSSSVLLTEQAFQIKAFTM